MMTSRSQTRAQRLTLCLQTLEPTHLSVDDISNRHAGHPSAPPEGESHFAVSIVSPLFRGLSRIEQHRLVYDAVQEEDFHALKIKARPAE